MTEMYLLPITEAARVPEPFGERYFPRRMMRARRFLRPEDRLRCIGAGALLHGLLGIREDELRENAQLKPFAPSGPHFNLSHSGQYILLAVDDGEIGADIEQLQSAHLDLAPRIFQPTELAWMREDPLPRFYTLWTLKESVMKQRGRGLALAPESFSVLPLLTGGAEIDGERLYAAAGMWDGHAWAVCAAHPIPRLTPRTVTAEAVGAASK